MNRPLLLLLGTGAALGLNFPLGKVAMASGVNPALWAAIISLGAGLSLLIVTQFTERAPEHGAPIFTFAVISGFVSYVMPNFLTFLVIPKIGSGLAAIMFALSPVVTALLSTILRVRPPNLMGLAGIALGLAGALIIIFSKGLSAASGGDLWILVALLIPLFLGLGNVYRTMAWPKGATPRSLASRTNLAAVPFLLAAALLQSGAINIAPLNEIPFLIAAQVVVSTIMFLMFFRLQQIGGPTYLSQIGYVAAAVGVVIGVAFLGETYPLSVWVGAGIIAAGILLTTISNVSAAKNNVQKA
jgi:drug/metabolite transporter (DMT)-like permease